MILFDMYMSRRVLRLLYNCERTLNLDHTCRLEGDSGKGQKNYPHDVDVVVILMYVDNTGLR